MGKKVIIVGAGATPTLYKMAKEAGLAIVVAKSMLYNNYRHTQDYRDIEFKYKKGKKQ